MGAKKGATDRQAQRQAAALDGRLPNASVSGGCAGWQGHLYNTAPKIDGDRALLGQPDPPSGSANIVQSACIRGTANIRSCSRVGLHAPGRGPHSRLDIILPGF